MADKGGGIVIQDRATYLDESHRLLNTNAILKMNPLPDFIMESKNLITMASSEEILSKSNDAMLPWRFLQCTLFLPYPQRTQEP